MVGSTVVAQKNRRSPVRGHNDIQVSVVIEVSIGSAATDSRLAESVPEGLRCYRKSAFTFLPEHLRRLRILDPLLDTFDIAFKVAIGDKDIEPAIQIVIEEETSEAECEQAGAPNSGARRFVDKQSVAFVVVEGQHLVGKIRYQDTWISRPVVVRGIHSHPGARDSVLTECHTGRDTVLGKAFFSVVDVQTVGLCVVSEQEIRP